MVWSYQLHWYLRQAFLFISFFPPSSSSFPLTSPLPSFLSSFFPSFFSLPPPCFLHFLSISLIWSYSGRGYFIIFRDSKWDIERRSWFFNKVFSLLWESFTRVLLDKKGNLCLEKYMYVFNSPFCNDLMSKSILWSL